MKIDPAQLLAATSYAVDLTADGCRLHGWRVAILSYNIALAVDPNIARDVFYAGLIHDASAVGTRHHAFDDAYVPTETEAQLIINHPMRGSTLLKWLPGMENAASYLESHHEYWAGGGYPNRLSGADIPLGGQILCIADWADAAGCFERSAKLADKLRLLAGSTGRAWSRDMWSALVECVRSAELYRTLSRLATHPESMRDMVSELGVPEELDSNEGVERALHLFPALIDIKDPSTAGHSLRTAKYGKQLARVIGLRSDECSLVYRAGLVHDCGRLGLPSLLLNTSGRLDDRGLQMVRKHAAMTIRSMGCLPDCQEMAELGRIGGHDHERYDGKGYPDHLAGEDIPQLSRILSVVDAYDAMVTPRGYRLLSPRAAVLRLQQGAGTQFDPIVVEAMIAAVESSDIQLETPAAA